ncbi:MAG TPA: helix-turn-helix domain-containing protein [Vicinamibacterales bacterium]|jgi:AraC family ethanolamine operon transcriptional activator|nr:helix-turn-helix domain-containing protein [Vicinamibacterales bacterium]
MRQSLATSSHQDVWWTTVEDINSLPEIVADGVELEYVPLQRAPFSARWTVIRLPSMVLRFGRAANPLVHHIRTHADRWLFVIPMVVPSGGRSNGSPIGEADIVVCPPGTENRGFDPEGVEFALVSMDGRTAAPIAAMMPKGAAPSDLVRTGRDQASALRQLLERIRGELGIRQSLRRARVHRDVAQGLCRAVLGQLRAAVRAAEPPTTVRSRMAVVCQAEDFVRQHCGERISVSRLSTIVGVSERSLRNAFHDVYATGPKRYLMIRQLHRVRRALRAPGDISWTVTDIATLHGFFELGRFAGDYKGLFGEGPSQTLSRARQVWVADAAAGAATFGARAATVRQRLVA